MLFIAPAYRSQGEVVSPLGESALSAQDLWAARPNVTSLANQGPAPKFLTWTRTLRRSQAGQPRSRRPFQRQSESHVPYCHVFAHSFVKTPGVGGARTIESFAQACTWPTTGILRRSQAGQPRSHRPFQRQSESHVPYCHAFAHSFVKTPGVGGARTIE